MFAGRGSAFVGTTTASRRGLTCLTEVTCRPATSWKATTRAVWVAGDAANAGTAAKTAQTLTAASRRFRPILLRSPRRALLLPSSTAPVEPVGDQPVRDGRGRRQQRTPGAQVVPAEPAHVLELVVAGAELAADGPRLEPEHQ